MSRSLKKGPYIDEKLQKKITEAKKSAKNVIVKTWSRNSVITPEMVGATVAVHNGKEHVPVFIIEDMIGHKFGEFSHTRKFRKHGGRMAREEEMASVIGEKKAQDTTAPDVDKENVE